MKDSQAQEPLDHCPLCGNPIYPTHVRHGDVTCASGGPTPDGCLLSQYGVIDRLRELAARRGGIRR